MFELKQSFSGPYLGQVFDGDLIDWDTVSGSYRTATDAPTCYFYRELAAAYPKAKVILTVRELESWWKAGRATTTSEGNLARFANSPLAGFLVRQLLGCWNEAYSRDAPAD